MKKVLPPEKRPRRFRTTRGLRRLSYAEAYSRRTTDSSRARVMALYGRSKPPTVTVGGKRVEVGKAEDSARLTPPTGNEPPKPTATTGPTRGQASDPGIPPRIQRALDRPHRVRDSSPPRRRRRRNPTGGAKAPR